MHENRETSGAPRPEMERGRSAKVQRHADTDALEESDRTVRSMSQTNKEERSSAKPGEKRVRTKENIVQPNTNPTQRGEPVSQGLSGVREAAKKRRQERFTSLRKATDCAESVGLQGLRNVSALRSFSIWRMRLPTIYCSRLARGAGHLPPRLLVSRPTKHLRRFPVKASACDSAQK
jgi:hypothetical protein